MAGFSSLFAGEIKEKKLGDQELSMLICRTLAELSPACLQELSLPEWSCTNALIVNVEGGMFLG